MDQNTRTERLRVLTTILVFGIISLAFIFNKTRLIIQMQSQVNKTNFLESELPCLQVITCDIFLMTFVFNCAGILT